MSEAKKCCVDVFVKDELRQEVNDNFQHIAKLYDVDLRQGSNSGKQFMHVAGCWYEIHGSRDAVYKAREYVKGLSNPEEVVNIRFPKPLYDELYGENGEKHFDLERETATHIVFHSKEEIQISGCIPGVTKAQSIVEKLIDLFLQAQNVGRSESSCFVQPTGNNCSGIISDVDKIDQNRNICANCSPAVDISCSELDSGCLGNLEANSDIQESTQTTENSASNRDQALNHHQGGIATADGTEVSTSRCTSCQDRISQTPSAKINEELMDYALKLGYSEDQVKSAMKKLGSENPVNQNELLHELIKASNSIKQTVRPANDEPRLQENVGVSHFKTNDVALRSIVIDGSNVAMSHGKNQVFSCRGIAIAVDWFRKRGHQVTVFVPNWRKEPSKPETPIVDREILSQLEEEGILSFTPSRRISGRLVQCYDDRFIVKLAYDSDGIIVSNDHFRDLQKDCPDWKDFIDQRLLMYTFAQGDKFMPPDDPLGRHGPCLDDFLKKTSELRAKHCPYGRKCTFGPKCKFYHPERTSYPSALRSKNVTNSLLHTQTTFPGGARPRSDPCQPHLTHGEGGRQRPTSLPNLEQLYISTPLKHYVPFGNSQQQQQQQQQQGRPVSVPPFPDGSLAGLTPTEMVHRTLSTSDMMGQPPGGLQRKLSGDYSHYSLTPPQGGQYLPQLRQHRRPLSGELGGHTITGHEYVGRPLSSDFSSRPSSGDFSYSSGSRPTSGEFGGSRPSSGDYGSLQWPLNASIFRNHVSFSNGIHGNQLAFVDTRNFYPVKSFFKGRSLMPETREEARTPNGLRIELAEQLRQLFPDQYDKILQVLRSHPEITALDHALQFMVSE